MPPLYEDNHASARYRSISLFSGAMGFDLGLEMTGRFETVAAVELDSASCATIRHNRDAGRTANVGMKVYEGDIASIDPKKLRIELGIGVGELDLISAGPPCQSFSTTGKRKSVADDRGRLLWQVIEYIDAFRPKTFLIENVRGLVSAALKHRPIALRPNKGGNPLEEDELPGSVIRKFLGDLRERLGDDYRMDVFEVNSANYGAPQIRERAIFIGNRLGQTVEFPAPTHGVNDISFRTLGHALASVEEKRDPVIMDFSPRKKRYLALVPPGGNWRCLPDELQRESMGKAYSAKGGRSGWWRRLSADLPCPTIVTMPNHASTALTHPVEVRALTVAECAAVQEFPRDWEFIGTPQDQYRQIGNAVPIRLGNVAGQVIADCLDKGFSATKPDVPTFRLVYVRSHVRTRQWFKRGETKVWNDGTTDHGADYVSTVTRRRERALIDVG